MRKIRTYDEFFSRGPELEREEWEDVIKNMILSKFSRKLSVPGYCKVCKKEVKFLADNRCASAGNEVNFRESLFCPGCKLNNRMRCMVQLLEENIDFSYHHVYMYEQSTVFYKYLSKRIPHLTGSEYLGEKVTPGHINKSGIRHEDATELSFEDELFDFLVSNDVFEHVSDIKKALSEAYRILKSGKGREEAAKILISVPFLFHEKKTVKRAEISNGKTIFLQPPMYHENPVDRGGSLVFFDYGWDLLEWIKDAGFDDVYFVDGYSVKNGNIGNNSLYFLIAEKW